MNAKIEPSLNFYVYAQTFNIASFIYVRKFNARTRVEITRRWKPTLTLFRLGFFGQSVTGGGGLLGPPLCISGTNNARVMKFTHNDHLRTKKPHTQF